MQVGAASAARHPHLLAAARDSATVTLVVFSMTDLSSFKALPAMLDELKGDTIFLVATKMDLVASCSVSLVSTPLACCSPSPVSLEILNLPEVADAAAPYLTSVRCPQTHSAVLTMQAAVQELAKQHKTPLLLVSNPPFICQPNHQAKCTPSPAFTNTAFTEIARAVEQKLW